MRRRSGGIADVLLLKEISDDLWLPLPAAQVAADTRHHLGAVARAALPQSIGLDVLVEELVRIELRAIAGRTNQAQPRVIGGDERVGGEFAV